MDEEVVDYEVDQQDTAMIYDTSSGQKTSDTHSTSSRKASAGDIKSNDNYSVKVKGRGHSNNTNGGERYDNRGGIFERIDQERGEGPAQSIEGWILFVSNVHMEAQEDDVLDRFSEYGVVKNIHVNLDRRTGFVKGYALVEFESYDDALSAIKGLNGNDLLGQRIGVDWAFVKK